MGDPVTPIPKGDLRLLRREALTMPITNETSASAVHDILQELHDDSTESINEHQSPPPSSARDVKKPTPRKGTFGMASPDRQRTTPSPPTPTPRLFSSAVRSIRDDADYEKGASATRVPPVRPAGTLSGLYGHHEDDEDEQYEVKEEITQQSREPGSKRKIRFEEQSSRDEGEQKKQEAILEELVGNESQQQAAKESAKDSGGQEVTGRSTPKVKQGFRLRFGGKRQQVDTQEHQQLDEAADDSDPPNKADQQPQEAADGVGKSGQDIDGEKALDQVGVPSRKSRFSFPRLEKNRGKLSEKDLEKESPGQENMSETAQADEEQADRGDLGPAKGRDDSKCSARQEMTGKRKGLIFISRFRGGRNSAPAQEAMASVHCEAKNIEEGTEPISAGYDVAQRKFVETVATDSARRRTFGAPWRRKKTLEDIKVDETKALQRQQQQPMAAQQDDEHHYDAEDEEVERIIDSDRADAHSQEKDMKDSVVASSEDAVKGQKPWNKFRFGNRKQQLQDEQVQEHDATLASSETTAAEPAIGRGAKSLIGEQRIVSEAVQKAKALVRMDRQRQHQQQVQQRSIQMTQQSDLQTSTGRPTSDLQLLSNVSETRLQLEQDAIEARAVSEEHENDNEAFVSRLFVDRFLTQRQNAPLPSPPPCSASMVRSVAVKPLAPSELYGSCLSRAGRTAQGLLGGLCLFLLLLLLSAEDDEVKRIFGGSGGTNAGGQAQLLQMVIYFLVIVSVITSFDGLNYKQIIFEHRLNRFVFTSVVYPAMLILGFIVTKLDNKLAYGGDITSEEWTRWKGVNLGRCACGLVAWIVLCL